MINTPADQKQNQKALQENPAWQELPEKQGCLEELASLVLTLGASNLGLCQAARVSQPSRGCGLRQGLGSQARVVCVRACARALWFLLSGVLSGIPA